MSSLEHQRQVRDQWMLNNPKPPPVGCMPCCDKNGGGIAAAVMVVEPGPYLCPWCVKPVPTLYAFKQQG